MTRSALAWRLAWRELRAGIRGFRVFIACLVLGVTAIAAVGSVSQGIIAGIHGDARKLLGGDFDLRLNHREATAEQRAWLAANAARLSEVAEMRAMVRTAEWRRAQPGRAQGGRRQFSPVRRISPRRERRPRPRDRPTGR